MASRMQYTATGCREGSSNIDRRNASMSGTPKAPKGWEVQISERNHGSLLERLIKASIMNFFDDNVRTDTSPYTIIPNGSTGIRVSECCLQKQANHANN